MDIKKLKLSGLDKTNGLIFTDQDQVDYVLTNIDNYRIEHLHQTYPQLDVTFVLPDFSIHLEPVLGRVSSKDLMGEVMKRGILNCIKEYKNNSV